MVRTPRSQPGVVGADGIAHRVLRAVELARDLFIVGHHRAQHQVGVAAHVLGAGDHRHLRAQRQRTIDIARAPGVVGGQHQAVALREGRHRAHVQHLEQQRARRFHVQQARVRTHQLVQRVVGREVRDVDVQALEHGIVQLAHRAVHAVRDQRVIAGRAQRQHHHRHGRQTRRGQIAMRAAFQLREDLFERGMRVHAHAAVGGGALAGGGALRVLQRGQVLEAHGAGAHGRQRHRRGAGGGLNGPCRHAAGRCRCADGASSRQARVVRCSESDSRKIVPRGVPRGVQRDGQRDSQVTASSKVRGWCDSCWPDGPCLHNQNAADHATRRIDVQRLAQHLGIHGQGRLRHRGHPLACAASRKVAT